MVEIINIKGEVTTAKKKTWITKAPKVLLFVLQRVSYDKKLGLQKNNSLFKFDKDIFIDRFMFENKKKFKNIFELEKKLKIEVNNNNLS